VVTRECSTLPGLKMGSLRQGRVCNSLGGVGPTGDEPYSSVPAFGTGRVLPCDGDTGSRPYRDCCVVLLLHGCTAGEERVVFGFSCSLILSWKRICARMNVTDILKKTRLKSHLRTSSYLTSPRAIKEEANKLRVQHVQFTPPTHYNKSRVRNVLCPHFPRTNTHQMQQ